MPETIEEIAARITRIALVEHPSLGRLGPGPVLTVVRNTKNGKIYVGLNTGIPENTVEVIDKAIADQRARLDAKEVKVVHNAADAVGGHSEVTAANRAIADEESARGGRKLTEKDLGIFELHNVWLHGQRTGSTAARCEHCARITRGIAVSKSVFLAEGGVTGEVLVPQRGSATRAGQKQGTPVTTTAGSINGGGGGPTKPGSGTTSGASGARPAQGVGRFGGAGTIAGGLLTAAGVLAAPAIKNWFAKNYLEKKWAAEGKKMIEDEIAKYLVHFNILVLARLQEIQKVKNAGGEVRLHVVVDTEWTATDLGPAQTRATMFQYELLFPGDTASEWPLFQKGRGFFAELFNVARITFKRHTFEFPL